MPKDKIVNKQTRRTEFTKAAERDLEEIWTYLYADNSLYAEKLIKDFLQKFRMLADNPNLGKSRSEVLINLRSFPFKKYVSFLHSDRLRDRNFQSAAQFKKIESIFDDFFEDLKMPENR